MSNNEIKTNLRDLYRDCSDYLRTASNNMVRTSKDALEDSILARHMEVRDIVSEAHKLGVVDADELFKKGTWIGNTISNIKIDGIKQPFYNTTIQTPAEGRPLRASTSEHVNNPNSPYEVKNCEAHLDGVVSHIKNATKNYSVRLNTATPS